MLAAFVTAVFVAAVVAADVVARRRGRVAVATARLHEVRLALVSVSQQHRQLTVDARRETAEALLAERQRLAVALSPLCGALDDVLRSAPADHLLTPGVQLVARQLRAAVDVLDD